jgi:hypothetical protein
MDKPKENKDGFNTKTADLEKITIYFYIPNLHQCA